MTELKAYDLNKYLFALNNELIIINYA